MGRQSTGKIKIYDEGKIDIHRRREKFKRQLDKLPDDDNVILENRVLITDFIKDCMLGKTIKGKSKKKIGPARCLKYIGILKNLSAWFDKPFNKICQIDMEDLIQRLESDRIISAKKTPYSEATKVDIKKTIKKFWKWKDGNNKFYPELVDWLDTCETIKDVPALIRAEIETMLDSASSIRDRALVMVLFDSGARVEEILNVRLKREHLFWNKKISCYMIRLEFSKTKPRTISLPLSTECMTRWLKIHPAKDNPQSQLFPMTYPALKMVVKRLGNRALGKNVTPHTLRHSSATFYANRLKSPYKLCYRYGWTMASKEVNRYLDREGILEEETPTSVRSDELAVAYKENRNLKEELSHIKESYMELRSKFDEMHENLETIQKGKGILTLLMNLAKQEGKIADTLNHAFGKKFDFAFSKKHCIGSEY
jgi:integrase